MPDAANAFRLHALPREPEARYAALVMIAQAVVEQIGEVTARALAAALDEAAEPDAQR